jgi:hypothetical protein
MYCILQGMTRKKVCTLGVDSSPEEGRVEKRGGERKEKKFCTTTFCFF